MDYFRVLIVGETFRSNGGGGITLTNLFLDWPSENIGVITDRIDETDPESKYAYYQLGREEVKFPFPFHFIQNKVKSGPYHFYSGNKLVEFKGSGKTTASGIKRKIRPLFDKFLRCTGLFLFFYRIRLSESLKHWILDFKPDIVYIQPFHYRIMQFGNVLFEDMKIPYAVHIMDDSVRYLNNQCLIMKGKLRRQIENDFKKLLSNSKVSMCISEAMSNEYSSRYRRDFLSFRNPIDIDRWLPYQKKEMNVSSDRLKIIYNGRLFLPTFHSLIDMCLIVDELNSKNKLVELDIYTYDYNPAFIRIIQKLRGVRICVPVGTGQIPQLIQQYDIFFLCLDFDKRSQSYSQFSISTRTSEGMISAVPILVYAPANSAMFKYFDKNEAGCLVGERDILKLEQSVLKLWNDISYREKISNNAVNTALSDSNSIIVREKFRKALTIF